MRSYDLINWEELPGAMTPLENDSAEVPYIHYWAPEVYKFGGKFYLYYSVGNEIHMHLRVAVAERPEGPYTDSGNRLTNAKFAIDAHVFKDDDGTHHLFYATDFLDHTHIGTGTVRDKMIDPFTLEGNPAPVTRARYDWQVYDPNRIDRGGVRWHTVEGPFVIKRKGIYYEMFSGGNWQNISYGVSFANTRDLNAAQEWSQVCDGERTLPILRTIPASEGTTPVTGPGHNSVIPGPSNLEYYCVYHQWDPGGTSRVLSIDRMDWIGEELTVLGPTTSEQPAPAAPSLEYRDVEGISVILKSPCVVIEAEIALTQDTSATFDLTSKGESFTIDITPAFILVTKADEYLVNQPLPWNIGGFELSNSFALRIELNNERCSVTVEGQSLWSGSLQQPIVTVDMDTAVPLPYLSLTYGWQDLFTEGSPRALGWRTSRQQQIRIEEGELRMDGSSSAVTALKDLPGESYELVVNSRLHQCDFGSAGGRATALGIYPCYTASDPILISLKLVSRSEDHYDPERPLWKMQAVSTDLMTMFTLPEGFDPSRLQQFRFRKIGGTLTIQLGQDPIGTLDVPKEASHVGLYANGCEASFEMVRCIRL